MLTIHKHSSLPTCTLLYISILLVTLSNDVQLNPGPRPPKYPCGSCGNAVKQNQNLVSRDSRGCQGKKKAFWEWKLGERPKTKENWLVINRKITTSNLRKLCRIESARQRQSARQEILDAKYEDTRLFHRLINKQRGHSKQVVNELHVGDKVFSTPLEIQQGFKEHFDLLATPSDDQSFDKDYNSSLHIQEGHVEWFFLVFTFPYNLF